MISKSLIFIVLFISLVFSTQYVIAAENYSTNTKSWEEWDELVQKYPNNKDIQALHALRIGPCAKVERGHLTVEQATEIFERAREAIVKRKRAESDERKEGI